MITEAKIRINVPIEELEKLSIEEKDKRSKECNEHCISFIKDGEEYNLPPLDIDDSIYLISLFRNYEHMLKMSGRLPLTKHFLDVDKDIEKLRKDNPNLIIG